MANQEKGNSIFPEKIKKGQDPCPNVYENSAAPTTRDKVKMLALLNSFDGLAPNILEKGLGINAPINDSHMAYNKAKGLLFQQDENGSKLSRLLTCTGPNSLGKFILDLEQTLRPYAAACGSQEARRLANKVRSNFKEKSKWTQLAIDSLKSTTSQQSSNKASCPAPEPDGDHPFPAGALSPLDLVYGLGLKNGFPSKTNKAECEKIMVRYHVALGAALDEPKLNELLETRIGFSFLDETSPSSSHPQN